MVPVERPKKEEATNTPFMLLSVFVYLLKPKRKLLFSLRIPGVQLSVLGGIKINKTLIFVFCLVISNAVHYS